MKLSTFVGAVALAAAPLTVASAQSPDAIIDRAVAAWAQGENGSRFVRADRHELAHRHEREFEG